MKCMSRFLLVVTQVSDFHISNSQSNKVCRVISIYQSGNVFRLRYLLKVLITPKYFFCLNESLHLFETHCAFLN